MLQVRNRITIIPSIKVTLKDEALFNKNELPELKRELGRTLPGVSHGLIVQSGFSKPLPFIEGLDIQLKKFTSKHKNIIVILEEIKNSEYSSSFYFDGGKTSSTRKESIPTPDFMRVKSNCIKNRKKLAKEEIQEIDKKTKELKELKKRLLNGTL